MTNKYKISILIQTLVISFLLGGCAFNVPLSVDPTKDMSQSLPQIKKMPIKVGLFLSDDLKNYFYRQEKMGLTFQMNVGEYLPPISVQMASALFEDITVVNSLPPYTDDYKPDVEAVVVPEILYAYGNAVGTLSGYIDGKVMIRITAYDLSGSILWQDETLGESRSREMNFVDTFLGGMKEVGKTGYQAAFNAAIKIINDFNASPPKELYSFLEIKDVGTLKHRRNISNPEAWRLYSKKGEFQYDKKNYYHALYSFEEAEKLNPDDQWTLYRVGVCYSYIGAKEKALEKFRKVVDLGAESEEAVDSKNWMTLLRKPLKIAVVSSSSAEVLGRGVELINQALRDSKMYEIIDVSDLKPPSSMYPPKEWDQFLERCSQKDIKIVLLSDIGGVSQKVGIGNLPSGDVATEYVVNISSKAYSSKQKAVKADIKITERTSTIREQSKQAEDMIKLQLLKNGTKKIVLGLLRNNIGY